MGEFAEGARLQPVGLRKSLQMWGGADQAVPSSNSREQVAWCMGVGSTSEEEMGQTSGEQAEQCPVGLASPEPSLCP